MADLIRALAGASGSDIARLQELLDGLLAARPVHPVAELPPALEAFHAAAPPASGMAPDEDGALAQARAVAAGGAAAFGAVNALLLDALHRRLPSEAESDTGALLRTLAQEALHDEGAPWLAPAREADARPLDSDADWAAAGAADHALLAGLAPGDALAATDFEPVALGGTPADSALTNLDHAIARLDAQMDALAGEAAVLGEPIAGAEVAAAADALAGVPLPELLTGAREAADALQDSLDMPGLDGLELPPDMLPDIPSTLEILDGVPQVTEAVVDATGNLLDGVGTVVDGVDTSVGDIATGVLDGAGDALTGVLDPLLPGTDTALGDAVTAVPEVLDGALGALVDGMLDPVAEAPEPSLVDAIDPAVLPPVIDTATSPVGDAVAPLAPVADASGDAVGGVLGELPSLGTDAGGSDGLAQLLPDLSKPV